MKILTAIIITILVMLQLFFISLVNAKTYFGYDIHGNIMCDIEVAGFRFGYWQHNKNDYTLYEMKGEQK